MSSDWYGQRVEPDLEAENDRLRERVRQLEEVVAHLESDLEELRLKLKRQMFESERR